GGAIAADVHGKNHHSEGSFSRYLKSLRLMTPDGVVHDCSPTEKPELFWATCGGMGLTGVILEGTIQLKKIETSYITEHGHDAKNVDALFELFESSMDSTYSVAWVDCLAKGKRLGKSVLMLGEHAKYDELKTRKQKANPLIVPKKRKLSVPFFLPSFTLNPLTIKAFNWAFYLKTKKKGHMHVMDYETYFYPLDGVLSWNRVYGRRGFAQYQFVIPPESGYEGMKRILEQISKHRMPSFLTVLKAMGKGEPGPLSFPMEGYTLALDFPMTKKLLPFLDKLDEIVLEYGGRLYLTKDSRMKPEMLHKGYPRLQEFLDVKSQFDSGKALQSMQSKRLEI
ncbi:MAG: FAD-binding protein, partial [Bacteroidota bacterium]